jgi:hypothetical protein
MDDLLKTYKHKWYLKNKKRILGTRKEYAIKNKLKIKKYKSELYFKNKAKVSCLGKERYLKNKDYIKIRVREYYLTNREKLLLMASKYQSLHREKRNVRTKKRYYSDSKFKLNNLISGAIWRSLKNKGTSKKGYSYESLLNYSQKELKNHLIKNKELECAFLKGKLDIDHKTPLSWFCFSSINDVEFKKAWALENLQLLPKKVNRIKKNFYCSDVMLALSLIGRN